MSATRPLPDTWVVRTPDGERLCRREGGAFVPVHRRWLSEWTTLLFYLAGYDFRARYRAQALGIVWSLLQPLVMMGLLSLVFARVFKSQETDLPIFLLVGLLVWQWVSAALTASTTSFVVNAELVKRTVFPRTIVPLSTVLGYGINGLVESLALIALVPFFPGAFRLSWALLAVPVLLFCLTVTLAGISLATSVLNVLYRDVAYLVSTALLLFYWVTPVIYPPSILPEGWTSTLAWNPFAGVITGLRGALLHGAWPSGTDWMRLLIGTGVVAAAGTLVFRRYEREMLDYV